jgi:RNA polymerase sigma factor (sigma-70 family)
VYRRWDQLGGQDLLGGYTHQTLLHTFIGERRRPRWTNEILVEELPEQCVVEQPFQDIHGALHTAIGYLGARQRAVIALRFWDDLSVEQTAQALGCTPGTITSQTHRALTRLRTTLTNIGFAASTAEKS